MNLHETFVIIGLVLAGVLALAGLFRPFLGLLVLIVVHFVQPGELVPTLEPVHIERVYGVALLVAFLVYRVSRPGPSLFSNPVVFASLLLVGAACLSIPFSVWRGGAFWSTLELVKNVILLVLIVGLADTNTRMRRVLWIVVGLLAWFAASGMISYLHGEFSFQEGIARAEGINSMAGGPNELAGLILALLPFLIVLLRCSRNALIRLFLLGCGGFALATMVLTGARACILALVIVGAYFVVRSRHRVVWFLVCIALAGITWVGMPQAYRDRYLSVSQYVSGGELDASNELRLRVWKAGFRMFLDHPILGVGTGQFPTAYGTTYAGRFHVAWMNPHNLLLQVACELGVVGLIVFTYFLMQIVKAIRAVPQAKGKSPVELNYQIASVCGAMLISLLAISIVSHTLYRPYWYFLGGLVAANWSIVEDILGRKLVPGEGDVKVTERSNFGRKHASEELLVERRS